MLDRVKELGLLRTLCLINGQWVAADSGATINVHNPATGEAFARVPKMGASETKRAIQAAANALPAWRAKTAKERSVIIRNWFNLMMKHQKELAQLMTAEQGKPLSESMGEIVYSASFLDWFAEEAKRVYGDTIPTYANDRRILAIKQPVGVVAAITPWNFPSAMITRKAGPALAVGCTMVLKPASATPLSALALGELALQAGVPPGVFNVITGGARDIGDEMCANPTVRKLTFTGSTEIGRKLIEQCAPTVKKVSMELGGNAPFIVFDDADLDAAADGAMMSKFRNTGQTCVCANRIYVQAGVYEAFAQKLVERVKNLKVGNGMEDGVGQGPLIDMAAVEKVEEHITDVVEHGGRVLTGGKRHALGLTFFEPTVLADVKSNMKVAREETFGPVAPLFKFETVDEVIKLANDTEYGLASYFYAKDSARIWKVAESLEYGIVGINTGLISSEVVPFGGVKQSGLGREGSKYGIDDYLEVKYMNWAGL